MMQNRLCEGVFVHILVSVMFYDSVSCTVIAQFEAIF